MSHEKLVVAGASAAVIALAVPVVAHFEGEVRHGYKDPIGIVTACFGHTSTAQMGKTYSHAECRDLLSEDLATHNAGLMACIEPDMPPQVHAAFLSFAFNVGVSKTCQSTAAKHLNAGRWMQACAELTRWTKAGGKELPGLVRRRAVERALCEGRPFALGGVG